jgi:hydroxymethylpyrimidine pyrophosphatase-like HAD family hydrolase
MSRSAAEILDDARKLSHGDLDWLVQNLLREGEDATEEEAYPAWRKGAGEPEPGYEEWFCAGVKEALADMGGATSIDVTEPGIDKAYGIRKLRDILQISVKEMVHIGDALFPGRKRLPR